MLTRVHNLQLETGVVAFPPLMLSLTAPPAGLASTSEIRTASEAYWSARALVPISGSRRQHQFSPTHANNMRHDQGTRSLIVTLNRPFCCVGQVHRTLTVRDP